MNPAEPLTLQAPGAIAPRVAVVGAGMAGATCAAALRQAGWAVTVVDKARGPGGRMATRRAAWRDAAGGEHAAWWHHGAPSFEVTSVDFAAQVAAWAEAGWVLPSASRADDGLRRWQAAGAQPGLCRALLDGVDNHWASAVGSVARDGAGWWLGVGANPLKATVSIGPFDAVVLALPPAQAAPLLAPHEADWARASALVGMQPCWTLLGVVRHGVAEAVDGGAGADTGAWPDALDQPLPHRSGGVLASARRQSLPPGEPDWPAGHEAWVLHATAGWSTRHLEDTPEQVVQQLTAAWAALWAEPPVWISCAAHRWRYARPAVAPWAGSVGSRWHPGAGLGQCGDHLAGTGVEAAWRSGRALAQAMLADPPKLLASSAGRRCPADQAS